MKYLKKITEGDINDILQSEETKKLTSKIFYDEKTKILHAGSGKVDVALDMTDMERVLTGKKSHNIIDKFTVTSSGVYTIEWYNDIIWEDETQQIPLCIIKYTEENTSISEGDFMLLYREYNGRTYSMKNLMLNVDYFLSNTGVITLQHFIDSDIYIYKQSKINNQATDENNS